MIDASEIIPGLWQGGEPPLGTAVALHGFHTLVLCAREIQPDKEQFPGVEVIYAPNDDEPSKYPFTLKDLKVAVKASSGVASALLEGHNVLVTCAAGINRSGLVVALTLHRLYGWGGAKCIEHVRKKRGFRRGLWPISNPHFFRLLQRLPRFYVESPLQVLLEPECSEAEKTSDDYYAR